jgi:hypothetical protein
VYSNRLHKTANNGRVPSVFNWVFVFYIEKCLRVSITRGISDANLKFSGVFNVGLYGFNITPTLHVAQIKLYQFFQNNVSYKKDIVTKEKILALLRSVYFTLNIVNIYRDRRNGKNFRQLISVCTTSGSVLATGPKVRGFKPGRGR